MKKRYYFLIILLVGIFFILNDENYYESKMFTFINKEDKVSAVLNIPLNIDPKKSMPLLVY